jgi:nitrate/TMAO reductase-like tetraheme cytochrome c subunit
MMARFLAAIPISRPIFIALILGGLAGMLFMVFLLEFDHYSSTNEFCTSCHSMTYVEEEYQKSVHYNPVSGVRAGCGDCHVSAGVFCRYLGPHQGRQGPVEAALWRRL